MNTKAGANRVFYMDDVKIIVSPVLPQSTMIISANIEQWLREPRKALEDLLISVKELKP